MFKKIGLLITCLSLTACSITTKNQSIEVTQADYQRAEKFLPKNVAAKARNLAVEPQWIDQTSDFWYSEQDKLGNKSYFKVKPTSASVTPLFDHEKLKLSINHDAEQVFSIDIKELNLITNQLNFSYQEYDYQCDLKTVQCAKLGEKTTPVTPQYSSPNGLYSLNVKQWNLYLTEHSTNKVTQLTFDGSEGYPYAVNNMNPKNYINKDAKDVKQQLDVFWAPDSQTVITHRLDRRKVGKLHLVQSSHDDGLRPKLYSYYYPLAGDKHIPLGDIYSIDIASKKVNLVDTPKLQQTYYGGPIWGWWEDNNRFYFIDQARAKKRISLHEYNPENQQVRLIVEEKSAQFLDPWAQNAWILPNSNDVIWSSQRSGIQ